MTRFLEKLRALLWSRRSYALCYMVATWTMRQSLNLTDQQAGEIVVSTIAWVISDSIKPTGGPAAPGPPLGLPALAESVRFWMTVTSQLATIFLPANISAPITAALSTMVLGRSVRPQ